MAKRNSRSISFYATQPQYVDHLGSIAQHLEQTHEFNVYAYGQAAEARWRKWGFEPQPFESKLPPGEVVIGAAVRDIPKTAHRLGVLVEHGAGQSYGNEDPGYNGGRDRGFLDLLLVPNETMAEAHPKAVAVGSPFVDHLMHVRKSSLLDNRSLVVFAFHWDAKVHPLSGTAFDFYAPHFQRIVDALHEEGLNVAAHAHPRAAELQRSVWDNVKGVVWLDDIETVAATAGAFVADNTSAMYELAAIGVPVVCLDDPEWRQHEPVGLRFWDTLPGPVIDSPDRIVDKVLSVRSDTDGQWRDTRRACTETVFGTVDGRSAERAVNAITELVGS